MIRQTVAFCVDTALNFPVSFLYNCSNVQVFNCCDEVDPFKYRVGWMSKRFHM